MSAGAPPIGMDRKLVSASAIAQSESRRVGNMLTDSVQTSCKNEYDRSIVVKDLIYDIKILVTI